MFTASVPIPESAVDSQSEPEQSSGSSLQRRLPCRRDPDLWFAENPSDLEQAKVLCSDCPIKTECLAGALDRCEPWGVWGGEIFERGEVVARKRRRGRPRKHPRPEETGPRKQERAA